MIYFDNASTTSVRPEVVRAYGTLLAEYGNPDSLHQLGRKARRNMEESRNRIASMLKISPEEVIFTGSASEANTLAIVGYALANKSRGRHIITSNVEHSSAAHSADFLEELGFEVTRLPINEQGIITPEALKAAMRSDTILVSLMHVNNEMGAINDIAALADVVHEHPVCVFHSDCTQSFAKLDIPIEKLDLMTMSAHKIHGVKGSGMLVKKKKLKLHPIVQGGQQEQGLRGGTENYAANTALAKTIRMALEEKPAAQKKAAELKNYLRKELSTIEGFTELSPQGAIDGILCFCFDSITSEVLLNALDARGICVSAKSTCSSHDTGANAVLLAMGRSMKEATHSIRVSFCASNTLEEAQEFVRTIKEVINNYGLSL